MKLFLKEQDSKMKVTMVFFLIKTDTKKFLFARNALALYIVCRFLMVCLKDDTLGVI